MKTRTGMRRSAGSSTGIGPLWKRAGVSDQPLDHAAQVALNLRGVASLGCTISRVFSDKPIALAELPAEWSADAREHRASGGTAFTVRLRERRAD